MGVDSWVLPVSRPSLPACLTSTVVDVGSDVGPAGSSHEEEADDHVAIGHDVVDDQVVAAQA